MNQLKEAEKKASSLVASSRKGKKLFRPAKSVVFRAGWRQESNCGSGRSAAGIIACEHAW